MHRLIVMAAFVLALALPSAASAAPQTLTVKKAGTGTGTVTSSPAGIECGATCSAPFTEGSTVVLKALSGPNTAVVKWTGCTAETLENECKVTMSAAKEVTATFNLLERKLTVEKKGTGTGTVTSSPAGIECGATCSANFVKDTAVTLTGTPGSKTLAPTWSGCDSVSAENKCLVTMSAAKTVTATFAPSESQLTVKKAGTGTGTVTSSPAGIECGATCSAGFEHGALVTLTGSAAGANTDPAVQWTGCDSVNGEGRCLVTMSAAREVTATFNLAKRQLTVSKIGSGTGTVTSSPAGINCGATCSASFTHETAVTLEGAAGLHTQKVKWSGCDTVTGDNKCLIAMSAAKSVTASFELEPQYVEYTVSVQKKGTGQGTVTSFPAGIDCGEDCTETYVFKTHLTLVATPAPGSAFDYWAGGGCSGTGPCEATINSSRLVKAHFVAVGKRTLTVAKAGTGTGTVTSNTGAIDCGATCSAEIDASSKITLTATAAVGSKFAGWSGACAGTAATCKLLMNEARGATASFEKIGGTNPSGRLSLGGSAKVKGQKARLRAFCSGGACSGTLKLVAKIRNSQGQAKGLVIARLPYSLTAGASSVLEAKLSTRGLSLLRSQGRLRVRVSGGGVEGRGLRLVG
jgi:hypothetical protein